MYVCILTYSAYDQRMTSVWPACCQRFAIFVYKVSKSNSPSLLHPSSEKMEDPERLRQEYQIAVLQHQYDIIELAIHEIRANRKRRRRRTVWVRPWIGRHENKSNQVIESAVTASGCLGAQQGHQ